MAGQDTLEKLRKVFTVTKALTIKNLQKTYSSGTEALRGLSLDVEDGEFFGLIGPNGAGKSTTIGILTGLVLKSGGAVSVYGHDLDLHPSAVRSCLGVVPQEFNFNVFESVENILIFQAGYYGIPRDEARPRCEPILRKLALWDKRKSPAGSLSGGMKRRLMLGRALISQPRLLILDEPTAGLDVELRHSLWDHLVELNEQGTTIILTTHYLEEIENLCQKVAIIDDGQVLTCEPVPDFLKKLEAQSVVFDLSQDCMEAPALGPSIVTTLLGPRKLEVQLHRGTSFNDLFICLSQAGITVEGLRNKANRIEELFIDLITKHGQGAKA